LVAKLFNISGLTTRQLKLMQVWSSPIQFNCSHTSLAITLNKS
jgi:hypothetical protein